MACLTNYAVQCVDVISDKTGCFLFDQEHWKKTGEFQAIGDVYPDLESFYANTDPNLRHSTYIERNNIAPIPPPLEDELLSGGISEVY